jgi:hypothetical protein
LTLDPVDTIHDAVAIGLEVRSSDADHCFATWLNVVISVWRGNPSVARLAAVGTITREVLARTDGGIVAVSIVDFAGGDIPSMADEARRESQRLSKEFASRTLAAAHVVEGSGFWVAVARSVFTGIVLMSPKNHPVEVFDSADRAAAWISPWIKSPQAQNIAPNVTAAVLAEVRATLAARR